MKRFPISLIVLLLLSIAVGTWAFVLGAQQTNPTLSNPLGGPLTASSTNCSVAQSCVWMRLPTNPGAVALTITGTFSETMVAENSSDGGNTFATVATFTAPVTATVFPVSGMTDFRVRTTAFTSGQANVSLQATTSGGGSTVGVFGVVSTAAPAQSATGSLQVPVTASATGAASAITCTLPAAAGKFTYVTGFQVTGGGATAGSIVVVTLTGTVTGTQSFDVAPPTGAAVGMPALIVTFPVAIPGSAVNTAVVVNVPSLGAGNTNSACSAQGFQQ